MSESNIQFDNPVTRVEQRLLDLAAVPPPTLEAAASRLAALKTDLKASADHLWSTNTDKQAVLAEVSVYVEAEGLLAVALADLEKAQATATAALERVFKKLHAPRAEQRVWTKLTPAANGDATPPVPDPK